MDNVVDNENGFTDCKICGGSMWLHVEREWYAQDFGDLDMCECHPDYEPEPEPDDRDLDLSWIKYTE